MMRSCDNFHTVCNFYIDSYSEQLSGRKKNQYSSWDSIWMLRVSAWLVMCCESDRLHDRSSFTEVINAAESKSNSEKKYLWRTRFVSYRAGHRVSRINWNQDLTFWFFRNRSSYLIFVPSFDTLSTNWKKPSNTHKEEPPSKCVCNHGQCAAVIKSVA